MPNYLFMDYKKIVKEDIDQLIKLQQVLMKEHKLMEPVLYNLSDDAEEKVRSFFLSSMESEEKFFYGAYEKNKLVGYAFGWIDSRPPILSIQKIGNLSDICVSSASRKKGVGKQLLNLFVNWCKDKGVETIQLMVLCNNNAVDFYTKYGFRDFMRKMVFDIKGS